MFFNSFNTVMAMEVHANAELTTSLMHGRRTYSIDAQTLPDIKLLMLRCQQRYHCFILLKKRTGSLTHCCFPSFMGFIVNQDSAKKKKHRPNS